MKINEIIKVKRQELQLTQEKVAEYLGVSTPAVNKWEKGISYPDITLLPALARLLKTDLNTILSFNEDLTDSEIGYFANELVNVIQEEGFKSGYKMAMKKIQEYPNCDKLIYTVTLSLEGTLVMLNIEDNKKYYEEIEKMYDRIANSEDAAIRNQAVSMLMSKHMEREDYDQAQKLLEVLPKHPFDKRQLQANLYIKQRKYHEALELLEKKLIEEANEIQTILLKLMGIHIKENKIKEAEYFANISQKTAQIYDLWEYNSSMFQLLLT
jgi:putative transcriptional regulator